MNTLYLSESEIAKRILSSAKVKEWPEIAAVLERDGLPRIDPILGGRYWPAVKAFFDRRHGLTKRFVPANADGEEDWRA
ncbi:hypothetical protein [Microbaculum sp. FT89]|uniref:hypothetical protein n=1 Tax=Microbaculum sp. FT89 TaxID=3447298 RepID=UPI003F52C65F